MTKDIVLRVESPVSKAEITTTGWNLPATMTEEEWARAGEFLLTVDQARQWWLGDWWNACPWGEGREACEAIGVDYQNAQKCGSIANRIQFLRRRKNLSFSHHQEICSIEEESMQDKLLDWAESTGATVKALREKVQAYLAMKDWTESEKQRRFEVEDGHTVVCNMRNDVNLINWAKSEGLFVPIDRSTVWGNPYEIPSDGTREEVCDAYEVYFRYKKSLWDKARLISGKVLGCYCYPERCHGEYLGQWAAEVL